MICPFRLSAEFVYTAIKNDDGTKDYLQKEQRATYPECYEDECPFYNYSFDNGYCLRTGEQ